MPFVTRRTMRTVAVLPGVTGLAIGVFVWSGIYNIGADDAHLQPTSTMLRMMRERSIIRQTSKPSSQSSPVFVSARS